MTHHPTLDPCCGSALPDKAVVQTSQPVCRRCGGRMKPGIAIEQTYTGSPDFPDGEVVTMSVGGPGRLIDCMKCERCGWSTT